VVHVGDSGIIDLIVRIRVPISLGRQIRIVRADERGGEEERRAVAPVCMVVQPPAGIDLNFLVELAVDAAPTVPRVQDRPQRMVPGYPDIGAAPPVGGPRDIRRLDVGSDPFL
jgi:hypothetical protein